MVIEDIGGWVDGVEGGVGGLEDLMGREEKVLGGKEGVEVGRGRGNGEDMLGNGNDRVGEVKVMNVKGWGEWLKVEWWDEVRSGEEDGLGMGGWGKGGDGIIWWDGGDGSGVKVVGGVVDKGEEIVGVGLS